MRSSHPRRRIALLDELRGLCIVLMVFYHAFYTIGYIFNVSFCKTLFRFFTPAEPFFAGLFIVICGFCCHLSHSNLRRGLWLAAAAAFLSLVLWCGIWWGMLDPGTMVWFGILHFLATSILLYVLLSPTLRCIPAWLGILLNIVLFICCLHISPEAGGYFGFAPLFRWNLPTLSNNPVFYVCGLCPGNATGDYFPLLPWFFCFLAGCYLGTWASSFPKWTYRSRFPLFSKIGQHSLWIYLLHQPIIYGLCLMIDFLISRLP